jgi:hypothetical protein
MALEPVTFSAPQTFGRLDLIIKGSTIYAFRDYSLRLPQGMGVVGVCVFFVDIDPSAVPDCHRAIPFSV